MTERATDHTSHDPLLIAAYAAGDADGAELVRAQALVDACDRCARLAADLGAIAAATPSAAVPRRPRDFRLRPVDVETARADGLAARVRASLESFRRSLVPVGAGLATIGLAGLLLAGTSGLVGGQVATVLSTVGSSVGGPGYAADRDASAGGGPKPLPAASALAPEGPTTVAGAGGGQGESLATAKATTGTEAGPVPSSSSAPAGPPPLVVGSIALLGLGIVLFGLGRIARSRGSPEA
jgi:hypothetical protein